MVELTREIVELTREEYSIITKNGGIIKPQNMSTQELINTLNRYDSRRKCGKLSEIKLEKIAKIENISENELNQAKKLQGKSIDELREIARLKRIKNQKKLTKENLIISLLKSESSAAEQNFKKLFNNNNIDDTYDDKIRGKRSDIRMILSRLGNIVNTNDGKKIKREIYEIEKKKNLSNRKKKIYDHLVKLVNTLNKKETYQYHDRDDLHYYGIRDIENLFSNVDDYYQPILVENSLKNNYKYYESRGDKDKKLSVKQYLYKIMPYLRDIIQMENSNKYVCKFYFL